MPNGESDSAYAEKMGNEILIFFFRLVKEE
jgi:hypothetical protein